MMGLMQDTSDMVLARLRSELAPLRGLWHGMESDLLRLGFTSVRDLCGKKAEQVAEAYRTLAGRPPDPILRPYFAALIGFAETGVATPWWHILRSEVQARTC